jgi:hypothetical protein
MHFEADLNRSVAVVFNLVAARGFLPSFFGGHLDFSPLFLADINALGDSVLRKFAIRIGDEDPQSSRLWFHHDFTVNRKKIQICHSDFPSQMQGTFMPAGKRLIKDTALILHF